MHGVRLPAVSQPRMLPSSPLGSSTQRGPTQYSSWSSLENAKREHGTSSPGGTQYVASNFHSHPPCVHCCPSHQSEHSNLRHPQLTPQP